MDRFWKMHLGFPFFVLSVLLFEGPCLGNCGANFSEAALCKPLLASNAIRCLSRALSPDSLAPWIFRDGSYVAVGGKPWALGRHDM